MCMPSTQQTLAIDCQAQLKELSASATFAMSRGAKELFHTNFIAFLLETDVDLLEPSSAKDSVGKAKSRLLASLFGKVNPPEDVLVWREKSSLDLMILRKPSSTDDGPSFSGATVTPKEGSTDSWETKQVLLVVVEAKVKALPTKAQLSGYTRKLQSKNVSLDLVDPLDDSSLEAAETGWKSLKVKLAPSGDELTASAYGRTGRAVSFITGMSRRLLLAPGETNDLNEVVRDTGWEILEWKPLLDDLMCEQSTGNLLSALLNDYSHSTSTLLEILKKTREAVANYCGGSGKLEELFDFDSSQLFANNRIHDLIGKYAFNQLELSIARNMRKKGLSDVVAEPFDFETYTFMSHGKPGLGLELVAEQNYGRGKRKVSIGVQIQDGKYRHYISCSHPEEDSNRLDTWENVFGNLDSASTADMDGNWWGAMPSQAGNRGTFTKNAFHYVACDATQLTFKKLVDAVKNSLQKAADTIKGNENFRNEVSSFLTDPTFRVHAGL